MLVIKPQIALVHHLQTQKEKKTILHELSIPNTSFSEFAL
jgi:hypothetical protein